MLINTVSDLQTAEPSAERDAFLRAMLNDFVTFDDAVYPEDYDTCSGLVMTAISNL